LGKTQEAAIEFRSGVIPQKKQVIQATIGHLAMLSEEDEMSFTRWRDLLGTALTIALEELSEIHKNGAQKRHQHYVESCAKQYWTIIARITGTVGKGGQTEFQ
jgi:hypothetical protein